MTKRKSTGLKVWFVLLAVLAIVGTIKLFANRSGSFENQQVASTSELHAKGLKTNSALTCSDMRSRIQDFVKLHFSVREFNEEISSRTFHKYFQYLDPGKNFFTASDIETFRSQEKTLPKAIAKVDCRFATSVHELLLHRVKEASALVDAALAKPFKFDVDESIETDRKKVEWAKTPDELKERWRKQFKFAAMGMRESETSSTDMNTRLKKRFQMMKKSIEDRTADEVNNLFLNAFSQSLDPHSSYMLPEDQDEFKVAFSLQLVGIGASLSSIDGYTVVENVIPGGAAARDGRLKKGDKIVAVDSGDGSGFTDVVDMELNKVVLLIRGKKDTQVKLQLLRKDANAEVKRLTLELMRDIVHLQDSEARSDVMDVDGKKIGVINLPSFYIDYQGSRTMSDYRSSALDMAREIKKLTALKVNGIVVDLRRNGGGDLGECVKLTGLFIDRGPVVQVAGRNSDVESLEDRDSGALYDGPLAVLVNKQSASASEIFAGAIQDYGRGIIVGDSRTYGKGSVQNVIEIAGTGGRESNGAMKVTVSKFYRPSGKSNQEKGVPSDVVIPDLFEVSDLGESENDYALPYSTIAAHRKFKPLFDFAPIIDGLKAKSSARVAESKDFKDLLEKMKKLEKERENTQLSLKIEKKDVKATPTPAPAAEVDSNIVIRKDDFQLVEAAHILVDSAAASHKTDWTH